MVDFPPNGYTFMNLFLVAIIKRKTTVRNGSLGLLLLYGRTFTNDGNNAITTHTTTPMAQLQTRMQTPTKFGQFTFNAINSLLPANTPSPLLSQQSCNNRHVPNKPGSTTIYLSFVRTKLCQSQRPPIFVHNLRHQHPHRHLLPPTLATPLFLKKIMRTPKF